MDDKGNLLFAVLVDIAHAEPLAGGKVQLQGDDGILFAVDVLGLHVQLRPVKRRLILRFVVIDADVVENLLHAALGVFPCGVVVDVLCLILAALGEAVRDVVLHSHAL